MRKLKFVFVHGLSGWGSYDDLYSKLPYWGMRSGDLISYLNGLGFDSYAASVSSTGSAWDRACELYAQLTGSVVDYGQYHSKLYGHDRFGKDYSVRPLLPSWNDETKLVLLGHSFGGTTVRLFSEILANGSEEERRTSSSEELSPFFAGGGKSHIHSIVTLASPMNGTTAYDLFEDDSFDISSVKVPWYGKVMASLLSKGTAAKRDGRDLKDYADFDMHVDNAQALNKKISLLSNVYYFSVPCSMTKQQEDGTYKHRKGMEPIYALRADQIGAYSGKTKGGIDIGLCWRENDGLVNTTSAKVPCGDPSKDLNKDEIEAGIWNVHPTILGDHMWLQGGLVHKHDIKDFYVDLLNMIIELPVK